MSLNALHKSGQQVSGKSSDHFSTIIGIRTAENEATQITFNKACTVCDN